MFKRIISVLMVSAMAPGFAQERRALTVEECISLGLENSKSLHASQMQVQSSEAQASEVSASRLPSLKLAGGYTRLSEVSPFAVTLPTPTGSNTLTVSPSILNNFAVRASLAQPLFTGFRLESAQKMAEYHSLATREDYSKDRIDLVYEIKNAYWSLYKAFEVQKFVDENVDQVKAHLVDAQNLMEQGLATRNDVLKIQVQLSDAGLRQIDARNAVQIAMINLNNLTGVPLNTTVELATSIHPEQVGTKPFASLDVLVRRAIDNRPDVKGMRYSVQANEASVKAARSGWLPQVSLVANYYDSRPNSRILPARNEFANTWDVGVNVSLDLWNWETTAHQTAQAQAQLLSSLASLAIKVSS